MATTEEIEEIRRRIDIIEIVGAYVTLKPSGHVFKGLCPFHNEKTPSFQVSRERGWYCFGQCGEGGDVFKFLQKIENLTFPEALERLAHKAGVTLTQTSPGARGSGAEPGQRDRLIRATATALDFYIETLQRSPAALEYLEKRGLRADIIREFRIGYAGTNWDALPLYLKRQGIRWEDAVQAGVLAEGNHGGIRDKFGERIIFPIFDVQEQPIAFGGRLMQSIEGRPKYLNSAETPLFSKSRTLYGLWRARKSISTEDRVIIVEGYMDVVACHQAGFNNVIATLGTALTSEHAAIINRYATRAILAFDSDAAGQKAARSADAIFKQIGVETRLLAMPDGEDPDSVLRSGQRSLMEHAIAEALPVTEHQLRLLLKKADNEALSDDEKLSLFHREAIPLIRSSTSLIEQRRYVSLVARLHPLFAHGADYAEEQIWRELGGEGGKLPRQPKFEGGYKSFERSGGRSGRYVRFSRDDAPSTAGGEPFEIAIPARTRAECYILLALFHGDEQLTNMILELIDQRYVETTVIWRYIQKIKLCGSPTLALEAMRNDDPSGHNELMTLIAKADGSPEGAPIDNATVDGSLQLLRKLWLDAQEQDLRSRAGQGDREALKELSELTKQRKGL
jgi:DNA primase catalytic core